MKTISIVGTGYVGLVTGACLANLGNRVRCIDTDESKIAKLKKGIIPIYEPGLDEMVRRNMAEGRLSVTSSYQEGMKDVDFVFVAVGTPNKPEGGVNLSYLHSAYEMIGANLNGRRPIVVNKSTVPPGTCDMMGELLSRFANGRGPISIVSVPEFLREGHAVADFMKPARVIIGTSDDSAAQMVAELHRPLNCEMLFTDTRSAEMIKYASNAFLAVKISFINEIAQICDAVGVDVTSVAKGIGLDPRIGKAYLNAGIGYGGSCFPKDVAVLTDVAKENGCEPRMLNATVATNADQPLRFIRRIESALGTLQGARIAVMGLTFKPNTDDLRESASLRIVKHLLEEGAEVRACDPQACKNVHTLPSGVDYFFDPYQAAQRCDAVIIATEWDEYVNLDLERLATVMRGAVLADGRNVIDPHRAVQAQLTYIGVGRGSKVAPRVNKFVDEPVLLD